jgi:hypothetical protein
MVVLFRPMRDALIGKQPRLLGNQQQMRLSPPIRIEIVQFFSTLRITGRLAHLKHPSNLRTRSVPGGAARICHPPQHRRVHADDGDVSTLVIMRQHALPPTVGAGRGQCSTAAWRQPKSST